MRNAPSSTPSVSPTAKNASWLMTLAAGFLTQLGSAMAAPPSPPPSPVQQKTSALSQERIAALAKGLGDPSYEVRERATKEFSDNMDMKTLANIIRLTRHQTLEISRRAELLERKFFDPVTKADRMRYYYKPKGELPWINFPRNVPLPPRLKHLEGTDYASSDFLYKEKMQDVHAHFPYPNAYRGWRIATKYFLEELADYDFRQSYFVQEDKEMFLQRKMMHREKIVLLLQKREQQWHQEHPPPFHDWRRQFLPIPPLMPAKQN